MTLVIGRRFDDLAYLIADTQTTIELTKQKISPFTQAFAKFALLPQMAIAFSGDTFFLPNFHEIHHAATSPATILNELHAVHLQSERKVDFLALTLVDLKLFKIADGQITAVDAAYIGSPAAFENVQRERHASAASDSTLLHIIMLPEAATRASATTYCADVGAFNRMLETEVAGVGGFPVPYVADAKGGRFGTYTLATRRPLSSHEVPGSEPQTISFQGAPEGAFSLNFGGSSNAFACHIKEGNLGLEWHTSFGFDVKAEQILDWRFLKKIEATYGIQMTKFHGHPVNQIINALLVAQAGNFRQAIDDVDYAIAGILQSCKDANEKNISWQGQPLFEVLNSADVLKIPLEEVGYLLHCFRLRRQFFADTNDQNMLIAATNDLQLLENATRGHLAVSHHKLP